MPLDKSLSKSRVVFIVLLLTSMTLLWAPAQAQETPTPVAPRTFPIIFSGPVESLGPRFIVVNSLLVDLEGAEVPASALQLGVTVTVMGNLQNSVVRATSVQLSDDDTRLPPPTSTPIMPTAPITNVPTPGRISITFPGRDALGRHRVVIQGPLREITPTSLRIFDLNITIDPNTVNLSNFRVGDNVRVEGTFSIVNNSINIVAVRITAISASLRDSDRSSISGRDSDRATPFPPTARPSSRSSVSDRDSDRWVPPPPTQAPPPPPPPPPSSDRSSRSSRSS